MNSDMPKSGRHHTVIMQALNKVVTQMDMEYPKCFYIDLSINPNYKYYLCVLNYRRPCEIERALDLFRMYMPDSETLDELTGRDFDQFLLAQIRIESVKEFPYNRCGVLNVFYNQNLPYKLQ